MEGYLGQEDITESFNQEHTAMDCIQLLITVYGGIDGSHHKDWLLDQIARLTHGGQLTVHKASWDNGHTEFRYGHVSETPEYLEWRVNIQKCEDLSCECHDPDDDHYCYNYDDGIAP